MSFSSDLQELEPLENIKIFFQSLSNSFSYNFFLAIYFSNLLYSQCFFTQARPFAPKSTCEEVLRPSHSLAKRGSLLIKSGETVLS